MIKERKPIVRLLGAALIFMTMSSPLAAKSPDTSGERQNYIVVLKEAPLAEWHRQQVESPDSSPQSGTTGSKSRAHRLNVESMDSKAYLRELDEGFDRFHGEAALKLGREIKPRRRYRNALNGFSVSLTAIEAQNLSHMPQVKFVEKDSSHKPETDAGPTWVGANVIWNGIGTLPAVLGAGIVIGNIDSGINWDHQSFGDPGGNAGSHDYINPLGSQKGLCSDPEVLCNDHLIGVYSFIDDDPATTDVDEHAKGKDDSGHGTHTASTSAGNFVQVTNNGVSFAISGVAPFANLISYKVCTDGDPADPDDDACPNSAILEAIDQAIADGVDVINYSLGAADPPSPWADSNSLAFLNARSAGIFVATSASNDGPAPSTIGRPANSPWITSVGNATHNRIFGAALENLTGGNLPTPDDIVGSTLTGTSGVRNIVHAKDFGNALCGTGPEELGTACADNTGATNPFPPGTFNGEIVVCDRGQYGRIEKGKNVMLAGAGGMILANTEEDGESIRSDLHCQPAIHIGNIHGDDLRSWLDSGTGHRGSISGFDRLLRDSLADQVASSSSRGPGLGAVRDILKPNLIAPGSSIIGAWMPGNSFATIGGTSMSSPHIAGAGALLLSVNNGWTPSMISSTLELTATAELAWNFDGSDATPHDRGAGRPRLGMAANAALYLNETTANFTAANPSTGGKPRELNLPTMTDANCAGSCNFTRTVTDLKGGASWTASASGFPAGVVVSVTPSSFVLASGGSRALTVNVDVSTGSVVGTWVYGGITLSSSGENDLVMPVTVFATGGDLPLEFIISTDENSGWQDFALDGLAQMQQATYTSGGLVRPQVDSQFLVQDPSRDDPYGGGTGVMTIFHEVPAGTLWFHSASLASTATDVDLFIGRDSNEDGIADPDEEICSSTTPTAIELCDILNPTPGTYWIVGQNWEGSAASSDEINIESAVIGPGPDGPLTATGPGIVTGGSSFDLRLSWQDVNAVSGEELLGAVGLGTDASMPSNIGIIPVYFNRNGIGVPKTFPLFDGREHKFALPSMAEHGRMFIDVPSGASSLTVTATGADANQNNGLTVDLQRVDFANAFSQAPFASPAPTGTPIMSASGSGGNGPQLMVTGGTLQAGRWYAVVKNANASPSSVSIQADVAFSQMNQPVNGNLLVSLNRGGISQGLDYQPIGPSRGLIWYTYTEAHAPAWYLSVGAAPNGDIWNSDLLRFNNDGSVDNLTTVGTVGVSSLAGGDSVFSWTLFGESGSERMGIITGVDTNPCPSIGGQATSVSGLWGKAVPGLGGASVLLTSGLHAEIHYMYDSMGNPVWLQAAGVSGSGLAMSQFSGDCPTCAATAVSSQSVGVLDFDFMSTSAASWNLDYTLMPPLLSDIDRTDAVIKLSDVRACD
ncbi:MAG: subtilisin family serine protease [Bacteroidia bacterium]|jgi:subtilisin family serine protease